MENVYTTINALLAYLVLGFITTCMIPGNDEFFAGFAMAGLVGYVFLLLWPLVIFHLSLIHGLLLLITLIGALYMLLLVIKYSLELENTNNRKWRLLASFCILITYFWLPNIVYWLVSYIPVYATTGVRGMIGNVALAVFAIFRPLEISIATPIFLSLLVIIYVFIKTWDPKKKRSIRYHPIFASLLFFVPLLLQR